VKIRPALQRLPATVQQHQAAALIVALVVLLTGIDLALLVAIGAKHPQPNTLSYEAAKACMQVLAVVLLGGLLSLGNLVYQLNRQDRQRTAELHRASRQRCDELVRETMRDVRSNYDMVKRSRRVLQGRPWDPHRADELVKLYDEQLIVNINNAQLVFEDLRDLVVLGPCGVDESKLQASFSILEDYLNKMVNEWRKHRQELIDNPPSRIEFETRLVRVDRFISGATIRAGVSNPIRDVMGELRKALLASD
jgi:hypothetical protein